MPIMKYNKIHTGANSQLGGLKSGFINVEYQLDTDEAVNIELIIPASWQTPIETPNLKILLLFIHYATMSSKLILIGSKKKTKKADNILMRVN